MCRIIVVDDHKIVRDCLRALLHSEKDFEVAGEATNGQDLLRMLPDHPADVVLMDVNMAGMDGLDTTSYLKEHYPELKVLAFSMLTDPSYARNMLQAGARGYITKNSSWPEVARAIRTVAAGQVFLNEDKLEKGPKQKFFPPGALATASLEEPVQLSSRELEVLKLIAEGFNTNEIADKLFNSKRTIETHRQNILNKTGCKNTAALIKYALLHKLIQ